MNHHGKREEETSERLVPLSQTDLSEASIRRDIRLGALQQPTTLLPLSIAAMAVIFILVLSPLFGWLWALVALIVSAIAALASFIWRYFLMYGREYERRVERMLEIQDENLARGEKAEMDELSENLFQGFEDAESPEGQKLLQDLILEHGQLQAALLEQADSGSLTMPHAIGLANETYRQGMSVLSDALQLMEATPLNIVRSLKEEAEGIRREIDGPGLERFGLERTEMKRDILESIQERISMLDRMQLRIDRLLFQVRRCEGALQLARVELIAIRTGTSEAQVDSVIGALQTTVDQVKEVQDELGRLGF